MKIYAASLLVASTLWCHGQSVANSVSPIGVWRQKNIKWANAPKELGYKERAGNSGILRFSSDGSFTLIYAVIIQTQKFENPSQGDAWTIYFGKWKRQGNIVDVAYSMIYRDIRLMSKDGKEVCPPSQETKQIRMRGNELIFDGVTYIRSLRLEAGVNKTFSLPPQLPPFQCPANTVGTP